MKSPTNIIGRAANYSKKFITITIHFTCQSHIHRWHCYRKESAARLQKFIQWNLKHKKLRRNKIKEDDLSRLYVSQKRNENFLLYVPFWKIFFTIMRVDELQNKMFTSTHTTTYDYCDDKQIESFYRVFQQGLLNWWQQPLCLTKLCQKSCYLFIPFY